ncbi:hypothetical protein BB560_007222, partial [Smittium megazygosporum]
EYSARYLNLPRKILQKDYFFEKCEELHQTKFRSARNRTSNLFDPGRPEESKGFNVKLFS